MMNAKLWALVAVLTVCGILSAAAQVRVGYATCASQASFTHCEPLPKTGRPEFVYGGWAMIDGLLQQTDSTAPALALCRYAIDSDHYTISCQARMDGGSGGFMIVFDYTAPDNYCQVNFGTQDGTWHALEQMADGGMSVTATKPCQAVRQGEWYDIKLTVAGDTVTAWLDGETVFDGVLLRRNTEGCPAAPDYSDSSQWYVTDRGAEADVFYIVSTETGDYPLPDGGVGHWADTYSDSLRAPLHGEMLGVDTLLGGRLNFYSPYYRQCSLQTFQSDSLAAERMPVALGDARRAFRYYVENLNDGRPFVLAGFSQGARIMLELLKEMDDDTFGRMIAAYAIGIAIPETGPHIVPATRADDTGVTICYNSVRDTTCTMPGWRRSSVAINPVNWRTDGTPATLITEPSPLLPVARQQKDTMTVSLDTATGLLIVEGYTAQDYMLPLLGVDGCYHTREIWLYRDQLRQNMALRASRKRF